MVTTVSQAPGCKGCWDRPLETHQALLERKRHPRGGTAASGASSCFPMTCCGPGRGPPGLQKDLRGNHLMWGCVPPRHCTRWDATVSIQVTWEEPSSICSNIQAREGLFPLSETVPFSVSGRTWARYRHPSSYHAPRHCPLQMLPFFLQMEGKALHQLTGFTWLPVAAGGSSTSELSL